MFSRSFWFQLVICQYVPAFLHWLRETSIDSSQTIRNLPHVIYWWCLQHITHYENKICLRNSLLMLEIDILVNSFIRLHFSSVLKIEKSEGCSTPKFDSNWACPRAWGSLIGVGWSFTAFAFIDSSFKSKPKWVSLSHVNATNSTMLYSASIISSHAYYTYFSIVIFTIPRFKEDIRLANLLVASFTINPPRQSLVFIIHGKIGTLVYTRVGHSYMYLITHMRRKGIYHGVIYLRNWNSLHPISTNKYKFYHFRWS